MERKLSKDPELRRRYANTIRENIKKGHVFTVEPHDPHLRSGFEWYLSHHTDTNPNKPVKVRRVLNRAAIFRSTTLNQPLSVAPYPPQNLIFVLLVHKYVVSADIEGIFLQVGGRDQDISFLPFLWRKDPKSDVVGHQYSRHVFGARDSPTDANCTLQKTANDNMSTYPEAASRVAEKFYMDNYMDKKIEQAVTISRDWVNLLKLGGFVLSEFFSNAMVLRLHLIKFII